MKTTGPTVVFAVRTAKGEQRRIRSFLKQIEELGVELEALPAPSVRAMREADRFLNRYLDLLARETPNQEQLVGVMEALGGIDRVVKNAMAEILKSLGWRPEKRPGDELRGDGLEALDALDGLDAADVPGGRDALDAPEALDAPDTTDAPDAIDTMPLPRTRPGSARPPRPGRSAAQGSEAGKDSVRGKVIPFPGPRGRKAT
jgi:hypothetical protein